MRMPIQAPSKSTEVRPRCIFAVVNAPPRPRCIFAVVNAHPIDLRKLPDIESPVFCRRKLRFRKWPDIESRPRYPQTPFRGTGQREPWDGALTGKRGTGQREPWANALKMQGPPNWPISSTNHYLKVTFFFNLKGGVLPGGLFCECLGEVAPPGQANPPRLRVPAFLSTRMAIHLSSKAAEA